MELPISLRGIHGSSVESMRRRLGVWEWEGVSSLVKFAWK